MKHSFWASVAFIALLAAGCGKSDPTPTPEPDGYINLSSSGTANCYIVSKAGKYKFTPVKGNDPKQTLDGIDGVQVLWETFGTAVAPDPADLVYNVKYEDGVVGFEYTGKKGNALIAVKKGYNVLWSWHIWCCGNSVPSGQEYNNNAGTMMDRNLGATSATPGDVGALGLLYQWGRKDPFLSSSDISSNTVAASTLGTWFAAPANPSNGTIEYATAHPTLFITSDSGYYDWLYSKDDNLWASSKTIYDPCPPGWRVPDGGDDGVWSRAFGSKEDWETSNWDSTNMGMNFGATEKRLGPASTIWYPASGYRDYESGALYVVGHSSCCWSCTPNGLFSSIVRFDDMYTVPSDYYYRACGYSVRCLSE